MNDSMRTLLVVAPTGCEPRRVELLGYGPKWLHVASTFRVGRRIVRRRYKVMAQEVGFVFHDALLAWTQKRLGMTVEEFESVAYSKPGYRPAVPCDDALDAAMIGQLNRQLECAAQARRVEPTKCYPLVSERRRAAFRRAA